MSRIEDIQKKLKSETLKPNEATQNQLASLGIPGIKKAVPLLEILRRPEATFEKVMTFLPNLQDVPFEISEQVEISAKYEGYIAREKLEISRADKVNRVHIPTDFDYEAVPSLSNEVREKLLQIQPKTLGQASRISGMTPAAIAILSIYLRKYQSRGQVEKRGQLFENKDKNITSRKDTPSL
jgi:tRNA uridine 5-carboxymethylaminomethyl modification enzyme